MLTFVLWQQCMLPEDDRVIETCRRVLSTLTGFSINMCCIIIIIIIIINLQMGCRPVAVVIMHVHKYETKIT